MKKAVFISLLAIFISLCSFEYANAEIVGRGDYPNAKFVNSDSNTTIYLDSNKNIQMYCNGVKLLDTNYRVNGYDIFIADGQILGSVGRDPSSREIVSITLSHPETGQRETYRKR